jgi:hypothetical protein
MMTPSSTIYKAFNLIVTKTYFPAGIVTSMDPMINNVFQIGSTPSFVWLYTKGRCSGTNTKTGEKFTWVPGDCSLVSPYPQGEWRADFEEDTELLCINPFMNQLKLPLADWVTHFTLKAGEATTIPTGTKLFLGVGSLQVESKIFSTPSQIHFASGSKSVIAVNDVYGFIVL